MKLSLWHVVAAALCMTLAALLASSWHWWLGDPPEWGYYLSNAVRTIAGMVMLYTVVWFNHDRKKGQPDEERTRALVIVSNYQRWLAARPETAMVLDNLAAELRGDSLDVCWPPQLTGPWEVSRLRAVLEADFGEHAPRPATPRGDLRRA